MILWLCCVLFAVQSVWAEGLVPIPPGSIEAIWLTPVTAKKTTGKVKVGAKKIKVSAFSAQIFPVTEGDFFDFLTANPSWKKDQVPALYADEQYIPSESLLVKSRRPMTYVSWFSARAYCRWKGLRLPTVNEWEYMAAASEVTVDANRDSKFLRRILDWYGEPREEHLKPVGSIYKNLYGLWDLHGLIWEWTEDFNSNFMTGESREDTSFNKNMFCGAGAMSSADKENYAAYMRFAFRSGLTGRSALWNLGFRCVK